MIDGKVHAAAEAIAELEPLEELSSRGSTDRSKPPMFERFPLSTVSEALLDLRDFRVWPETEVRNVRDLVAIGWKADVTRTSNFGRD